VGTFLTSPPEKNWPLTYDQLLELAEKIRSEPRERPQSRQNTSKRIEIVNG